MSDIYISIFILDYFQVLPAGAVGSSSSQPQLAPNINVQQSDPQDAGTRNLQQPSVQVLEVEEEMEIEELEQINAPDNNDDEHDIQEVEQDIQEVYFLYTSLNDTFYIKKRLDLGKIIGIS